MTITTPTSTLSIGDLAGLSGLSVHTLRWYESQGLFPREVPRTSGGRRYFTPDAVGWVELLTRLRESGMPIAEIARYAELVRDGDGNEETRIAIMENHERNLDDQIEELLAAREVIRAKVTGYREALRRRAAGGDGEACSHDGAP